MSCSAMQVRRFKAGELRGADKERLELHLAGCERCGAVLRELQGEDEALRREVPFDVFAAGVAERLARRPAHRFSLVPLAAAAALLLLTGTFLVLRPADDSGVRTKGGVSAQLFVQDAHGVRELGSEPVAPGAKLLVKLHPDGSKRARAILIEPGEESVVYDGPALSGPLPQAFEWTGSGPAILRIIFSKGESGAQVERSGKGGANTVIEFPLHR